MGMLIVIHTFGSDLKWHPHVHLIVTGGGLSLDGKRWIQTDPRFLMSHVGLKKRWKYHVIRLMKKAHRQGQWRFPRSKAFLKQYRCFAAMLNKLWPMTWYAFIGASLLDPRFSVRYIGRYTKRAVMAEYRITFYDGKLIRFRFRDYAKEGKTSHVTLKVHTFIQRLIRHVPDKHFSMIRYAGLFCNRWKARYIALATAALSQPDATDSCPVASASWAERQTEYAGVNPLVCPNCEQPMKHVAYFFGSWHAVQIVFAEAGKDDWIASVLSSPG
jgi:hypothetical protein